MHETEMDLHDFQLAAEIEIRNKVKLRQRRKLFARMSDQRQEIISTCAFRRLATGRRSARRPINQRKNNDDLRGEKRAEVASGLV